VQLVKYCKQLNLVTFWNIHTIFDHFHSINATSPDKIHMLVDRREIILGR
jgi:hypothetical protein